MKFRKSGVDPRAQNEHDAILELCLRDATHFYSHRSSGLH